MTSPGHAAHCTFREYLTLEEPSNVKHEYLAGQIYAMAEDGAWTSVVSTDGEVADLASIGARLDVRELYEAAAEGAA